MNRWVKYRDAKGKEEWVLLPPTISLDEVKRLAKKRGHVLIVGETGTGKDELAKLISFLSGQKGPFGTINCKEIASNLIQSELFGTVKGAFSDAVNREGLFQKLNGGLFILEEIGVIDLTVQAVILRVLQTGDVRKVGSDVVDGHVDVRVIATTNEDVDDPVKFRQDLFHRFSKPVIRLPSLANRAEDIGYLLAKFMPADGWFTSISIRWLMELMRGKWTGNIRHFRGDCNALVEYGIDQAEIARGNGGIVASGKRTITGEVWQKAVDKWPFEYGETAVEAALEEGEPVLNDHMLTPTLIARFLLSRLWEHQRETLLDRAEKDLSIRNSLRILSDISNYPFLPAKNEMCVPLSCLEDGGITCAKVFGETSEPIGTCSLLEFLATIHSSTKNTGILFGRNFNLYDFEQPINDLVKQNWPPEFLENIKALPTDVDNIPKEILFRVGKRGRKAGRKISDEQLILRIGKAYENRWLYNRLKKELAEAGYEPKSPDALKKRIQRMTFIDTAHKRGLLNALDQMILGYTGK